MTDDERAVKAAIEALFKDAIMGPPQAYITAEEDGATAWVAPYVVIYNGALKRELDPVQRWDIRKTSLLMMVTHTCAEVHRLFPNHPRQTLAWRQFPEVVTEGVVSKRDGKYITDGDHVRVRLTAIPPMEGDPGLEAR